jgi:nitroreductase
VFYSIKQLFSASKTEKDENDFKRTEFEKERQKAVVIRLVHSIEKGLCLETPRLGFGISKLNKLYEACSSFLKKYGPEEYCLQMAVAAVDEYLSFHEEKKLSNEDIESLKIIFSELKGQLVPGPEKAGGILYVSTDRNESVQFSEILKRRHSIREFEKTPVSERDIVEAVKAAQFCPSACNRQAYRAYVIPAQKLVALYHNKLSGIGGFAESADKFILITGKISAYSFSEYNQYIVSASIFASYLTLTLLDKKIGSCIVQRPLRLSKQVQEIMDYCSIPADEQIVLMMAIGNLKQEFKVPISGRYPVNDIVKFVK